MAGMIEAKELTKYYGNFPAIENVSFEIKKGEIVGFLGPNAAGKTTTMRIITGFMPPTSGSVTVAGHDVVDKSREARKLIGYLPETVPLYTDMTVESYLNFMGTLRGMNPRRIKVRIGEVIDISRLGDYRKTIIGKLSKGYRQRVGLAQAVLHEPEVLVLDEPTIGIDPIQVVETRNLIKDLGQEHTIILSSHILPEVSMVCQRVLIIHEGQIMAEDTPKNLAERLQGVERMEVEIRGPEPQVTRAIQGVRGVLSVTHSSDGEAQGGEQRITYTVETTRGLDLRSTISRVVISNGWSLLTIQLVSMSLEEVFLKLTTDEELEA